MKNSFGFTCYLIGLSMLGYLGMDMYLPAFGVIGSDLHLSAGAVGASLSIFLAGFAVGQLLWGPMSDRIGRKPVLLMGLSLFAVGCHRDSDPMICQKRHGNFRVKRVILRH